MSRRLIAGVAAWLALLPAMAAPAAPGADEFTYHSALTLEGEGPWYRLELPLSVQTAARHADMRDVRVFDGSGQPVPYALVRASERRAQSIQQSTVRMFPLLSAATTPEAMPSIRLRINADGTLLEVDPDAARKAQNDIRRGWVIDASAIDGTLNKLVLDWVSDSVHGEGFQRFALAVSDDLQHWNSLGERQIVRLVSNGEQMDQREVSLDGRRARYLRLLWVSPQEAPLLSQAQLESTKTTLQPPPMVWSDEITAVRSSDSTYIASLPQSLAVERLRIVLPQANTIVPTVVESGSERRWYPLARSVLYRIAANGSERAHTELEMPGRLVRDLRIRIDVRGGGIGEETLKLQVGLTASQLVFLARGSGPYWLAAGNRDASRHDFPLSTLIPGGEGAFDVVGAASLAELPSTEATAGEVARGGQIGEDVRRWLLWGVLLTGVGMLAAMVYQILRRPRGV